MLADSFKQWKFYAPLLPKVFSTAFQWIEANLSSLPAPGKYPLPNANGAFVIVQEYNTEPISKGKFENHHKFIDIQMLVKGQECIYWTNPKPFKMTAAFDDSKDIEFFEAKNIILESSCLVMEPMNFVIFWPSDWHMPCISMESLRQNDLKPSNEEKNKKIIFKIPVK